MDERLDWQRVPERPARGLDAGAPDQDPPARRDGIAVLWHVVLGLDLALLLATVAFSLYAGAVQLLDPDSERAKELERQLLEASAGDVVLNSLVVLVLMGLVPLLWAMGTRVGGWRAGLAYLRMHTPLRSIGQGFALAVPLVLGILALQALWLAVTGGWEGFAEAEQDPTVEGLLANLTWPIAILVSVCAGFGEEVFFRGVLQRWIGWIGQGIVFGLAHATGGSVVRVVATFAIGLWFGWLVRRGKSLWLVIACHAMYDFLLLSLALAYGDA